MSIEALNNGQIYGPLNTENKTEESHRTNKKSEKLNCWEFLRCGREPNGNKAHEICECPAATVKALPDGQYNSGDFLGRRCWRMAGTLCDNQIQGPFAKKIESCRQCLFYLKVKAEEGDNFVE